MRMYSSVRGPRSAKWPGIPSARYSASHHPVPTPRKIRPPDSASAVAHSFAVTTGLR